VRRRREGGPEIAGKENQNDPGRVGSPAFPGAPRDQCAIHDVSTTFLVLTAASASSGKHSDALGLEVGGRLRIDETPFAICLTDGQAVYADLRRSVERNSRLAEQLARGGAMAYFAVPLRAGDRTVGVLQSVCMRPSGFTNEQIQLLYLVADLLGPSISNCRLFGRLIAAYEELRHTQNHLIQVEKMRALGELAAGMAHDFNNSLCSVLGFLELALRDKDLPATCRNYLESSLTCTLDAAQTVRRVQGFARWRRNETAVELVDPNDLARQTVELTRHKWDCPALARKHSIVVEARTEATACVNGSSAELREVLTNLIFNAVDAMPQGGYILVRTWSTPKDVFLSVQDTGTGISEAVKRRLFEPFFTTKGERGNGMGLSVTFGIVKRHNGEITVESQVGKGSTFTVRLPAVAGAAPARTPAPAETAPAPAGTSLRILIVEDEESIRRFLAAGLTQLGHRPRVTADAQEGLAAFAEERFDVVLTDLGLPGINGEEVARQITERSPETPVVLLTGWADQIRATGEPVAGVRFVLGKPITLSKLSSTLTALCQG
jgi:signal transduction histidine kinase